jgi:hypothetical protein
MTSEEISRADGARMSREEVIHDFCHAGFPWESQGGLEVFAAEVA